MELHRSNHDRKLAAKGVGAGLAGGAIGGLGLLIGGPLGGVMVVSGWVIGGFILLVGLVLLTLSFRPFRIAFTESGLVVNSEGQRFQGSWDLVDRISIERLPIEEERYALVLWEADGVPMRHRPTFPPGGARKGHLLVEMGHVRESREEVAAALTRYAGEKFRPATPLG